MPKVKINEFTNGFFFFNPCCYHLAVFSYLQFPLFSEVFTKTYPVLALRAFNTEIEAANNIPG